MTTAMLHFRQMCTGLSTFVNVRFRAKPPRPMVSMVRVVCSSSPPQQGQVFGFGSFSEAMTALLSGRSVPAPHLTLDEPLRVLEPRTALDELGVDGGVPPAPHGGAVGVAVVVLVVAEEVVTAVRRSTPPESHDYFPFRSRTRSPLSDKQKRHTNVASVTRRRTRPQSLHLMAIAATRPPSPSSGAPGSGARAPSRRAPIGGAPTDSTRSS